MTVINMSCACLTVPLTGQTCQLWQTVLFSAFGEGKKPVKTVVPLAFGTTALLFHRTRLHVNAFFNMQTLSGAGS